MASVLTIVRPLGILALEQAVAGEDEKIALGILGGIMSRTTNPIPLIVQRYKEASALYPEPQLVPMHDIIMRHVLRPLIEAKHCYVLGMPVACIAQAGLVGEMLAIWRFRMLEEGPDKVPDEERAEALGSGTFDKMGQKERIETLDRLKPMDVETKSAFNQLRGIRRQYLHFMVDEKKNADADARQALKFAMLLVIKTLGLTIRDGVMVFPPAVSHFIRDIVTGE